MKKCWKTFIYDALDKADEPMTALELYLAGDTSLLKWPKNYETSTPHGTLHTILKYEIAPKDQSIVVIRRGHRDKFFKADKHQNAISLYTAARSIL